MKSNIKKRLRAAAATGLACLTLGFGTAKAEPAIWVVKQGHTTVYLFGTFHILKKGVVWETPNRLLKKAIARLDSA